MTRKILFVIMLVAAVSCQSNLQKRGVLVRNGVLSENKYIIVCKGYPGNKKVNKIQRNGLAQEAALINAQILARKFLTDDIDVIRYGSIESVESFGDYVVIEYVVEFKNIKKYLK
jgi:hypothetical protein